MSQYSPIWTLLNAMNDDFQTAKKSSERSSAVQRSSPVSSKAVAKSDADPSLGWLSEAFDNQLANFFTKPYDFVSPAVDFYDTPESYQAVVNVPGAKPKDVKVSFDPASHQLTVSGEFSTHVESQNDKYIKLQERRSGNFERTIRLPSDPRVDENSITAKFVNGVLKVTVPKIQVNPGAEPTRVEVTVHDEE